MKLTIKIIAVSAILLSSVSHAGSGAPSMVKTNRYTHTSTALDHSQTDLLSVIITIQLPSSIRTVGDAIRFVIAQSGYQLDESAAVDDSQYYLYQLSLPETHRYFDHVTLQSVLDALGSKSYSLVVNPVKRTISYHLRDEYRQYIDDHDIALAKSSWLGSSDEDSENSDGSLHTINQEALREYGPIQRGESLSEIAHKINQYGVKADIVMVAIYRRNSHAFLRDNMHLLIEGETLLLPEKKFVLSISSNDAATVIRSHNKRWYEAYGDKVTF